MQTLLRLPWLQAHSRGTDCCRFVSTKDHPSCRDNLRLNGTAGLQQVLKSHHEALATKASTLARGKTCHVTIIENWRSGGNWHVRLPVKQLYLLLWPKFIFCILFSGRPLVKFSTDPDLAEEECQRLLLCYMPDHIKENKITQKLFTQCVL